MSTPKLILAIVGLPGSGKNEIVNYIQQKKGWPKVYFGQMVLDEVVRRGQELNELNERAIREKFRDEYGMAAMAVLNLPKIREALQSSDSVLLESFYSWEEYVVMKKEFGEYFKVLSVWASPHIREQRLKIRLVRPLSGEEFKNRDYSQIENLHQAGPIARADYTILNEDTKEALYEKIDNFLSNCL